MKIDLHGQTALVTGASRGIGRTIATALGRSGAVVVGTATTDAGAERIGEGFRIDNIEGRGAVLNVADKASVEKFAAFLSENSLVPTILVNNAGITRDNLLLRMNEEEWEEVINTNLGSVYRLTRLCLRGMIKARCGRIINITSVVAESGNPGQTNYAAAKAGICGFTRSLAREVGSRGITVNAIAPGFIKTSMTDTLTQEQKQALLQQTALGRLGDTEEIAGTVVFLASQAGGYITGETINVNGGMYMA